VIPLQSNAAIRLINDTGHTYSVEVQTGSQRAKVGSLPAEFSTSCDLTTPPGESRYSLNVLLNGGEVRWQGQDGGVYFVFQSTKEVNGQFLGYIKPGFASNWVTVYNASRVPLECVLHFPNGDSKSTKIEPRQKENYNNLKSGFFNSSAGPSATKGEKREFEVKDQDGKTIYKGSTIRGGAFLVSAGADGSPQTVYPVGYN
ncbi:MAG TPA: hypothetical protein V6C69_04750, partial [Trichormus sp.]